MSSLNRACLLGNLGADPEMRSMQSGDPVANLRVATTEKWKDKNTGDTKEKTEWHRVVIFGKLADVAGKYLKKGSKVYIEGKIQTREWTDQNDVKKYSTEIVLSGFDSKMIMLDSKNGGSNNGGGSADGYVNKKPEDPEMEAKKQRAQKELEEEDIF